MTTMREDLAGSTDVAYARALVYRWLARAFSYPKPGVAEDLRDGLPPAAALEAWGGRAPALREAMAGARAALGTLGDAELESEHIRVFGHSVSPEWPPHETRYGSSHTFQESQDLADVAAFYEAFGLRVRTGVGERVDHVALELEFMHFLAVKQLVALERGETAGAVTTLEASRAFFRDHIGRWGPVFAGLLTRKAPSTTTQALGNVLGAVLEAEAELLEVTPGAVSPEPVLLPREPEAHGEGDSEEEEETPCGTGE
jgi:TorA maturation chaperone TorD